MENGSKPFQIESMIISGHQPAYLPWIGYFHKLSLCDTFVYMDTVQYLENDWNNRNKIRTPEGWMWLTVPIDRNKTTGKMLDQIIIRSKDGSNPKEDWSANHWKSIESNYRKTPHFETYAPELKSLYLDHPWSRLIDLCWAQFKLFSKWLHLEDKKIVRMSEMKFEGEKSTLVLDHCKKLQGTAVVFGTHGRDYVDLELFKQNGIQVYFQDYKSPEYQQRFKGFEPYMSIIDLVFNHGQQSSSILQNGNISYSDLVKGGYWEKT